MERSPQHRGSDLRPPTNPAGTLTEMVTAAASRGVVIDGEIGSGKTTVALAIASYLAHSGHPVLYVGPDAVEVSRWPRTDCTLCEWRGACELGSRLEARLTNADPSTVVVIDDVFSVLPVAALASRPLVATRGPRDDRPDFFITSPDVGPRDIVSVTRHGDGFIGGCHNGHDVVWPLGLFDRPGAGA